MTFPRDAIAAATHADPYPYYADLVARRPLYRDDALGLWGATSADAVTGVLASESCRVRPLSEPVPQAIAHGAAGRVFRHMIRMSEGAAHCRFKPAMRAALGAFDPIAIDRLAAASARLLAEPIGSASEPRLVTDFAFQLSVHVVTGLLGVPLSERARTTPWARDIVRSFAPGCDPERAERGHRAAASLFELFRVLLDAPRAAGGELLSSIAREAERAGVVDTEWVIANAIGLFFQIYDATAGAIGNSILLLASNREAREGLARESELLRPLVREVVRWNAPIQSTRRFVARREAVLGCELEEGDTILVVLAAANRDPALCPDASRFVLAKEARPSLSFGIGRHGCPGETIALGIAAAGVEQLLRAGVDPGRLAGDWVYLPSGAARVPLFGGGSAYA